MREWLLAFVKKCLGIQSPSALSNTGGKVKYSFDWLIIKRRGMRKNDRKSWEQFTVCICDKCGEAYEPDREHLCREKNSYPDC